MPRNLKDATYIKTFALNNGAGSTQSAVIDLGADGYKPETIEAELIVPALNATMAPDTRTVTYIIETSTTSNFAAVDTTIQTSGAAGAGGAGIAATTKRVRLPSNCARYIRGKVTMGSTTGDASSITATFQLLF